VTEEVMGLDLVQAQLRLAGGERLCDLSLAPDPKPNGFAVQARVNTEQMQTDGTVHASGGHLAVFNPPSGPGIRVDTYGRTGYVTNPAFDSLLAKVVAHSTANDFEAVVRRLARALTEFQISGLDTNISFLERLLQHDDFVVQNIYTQWLDDNIETLAGTDEADAVTSAQGNQAGASIDRLDPLASLNFSVRDYTPNAGFQGRSHRGPTYVLAPLQATVIEVQVAKGDAVREG